MASRDRSAGMLYPAMLAVLGLGFALVPLARGRLFFFWDNARLHFPLTFAAHEAFGSGRLLQWFSAGGAGFPTVAEGNAGLFQPIRLLFAWLLPPPAAFMAEMGVYLALAGLATYAFLRVLGASRFAALLAGLADMFGGFSIVSVKNIAHMRSLWVIPLVLLLAERFVAGPRRTLWILLAGLAFGMQFLTGNPHIAVVTAVASGLYVFFRVALQSWDRNEPVRRGVWNVLSAPIAWVATVLIGCGIAAIQVIPQAMHVTESTRLGGMSFDFAMALPASLRYLGQLFLPYAYEQGYQLAHPLNQGIDFNETSYRGIYAGTAIVMLAAVAVFQGRRFRAPSLVLFALAVTGTVLALGETTPLYPALWTLPVFNSLRFPFRFLAIPAVCVACLAGLGLAGLVEAGDGGPPVEGLRLRVWAAIVTVIGVTTVLAAYLWIAPAPWLNLTANLTRGIVVSVLLVGAAGLIVFGVSVTNGRTRQLLCAALVVFTLADLLWFRAASGYAPEVSITDVMTPPPGTAFLKKDTDTFRVLSLERWEMAGPRNDTIFGFTQAHASVLWGIDSADPFESLMLRRYFMVHESLDWELFNSPGSAARLQHYLGALNVKYVIAPPAIAMDGWQNVFETPIARTWKNPSWLPRAFLVSRAEPEHLETRPEWADLARVRQGRYPAMVRDWDTRAAEAQILDNVLNKPVDYATTAVVEGLEAPVADVADPEASVAAEPASANEMRFKVKTSSPAFLVVSSNYYPGWTATVNGTPARIYRTNWVTSGIFIPAGGGEVVFRFATPGLTLGAVVSIASTLAVGAMLVAIRRRRLASQAPR